MTLREMLKYRHSARAWVGVCQGVFVTMIVSGPVAGGEPHDPPEPRTTEIMFHAGADAGERVGRHRALLAIEVLVPADGRDDAGRIEHPEEWSFTLPEVRAAIRALPDG